MAVRGDITLFTDVDRTQDPDFYRRFLDEGNANPGIRVSKPILLDQLRLEAGHVALDAGCGTGDDVLELAARVGPSGRVIGVDLSEAMIEEATRRAEGSSLPVAFQVADAQQLPFEDETFDAVRTERLLMHVPDAERALADLVRVTKRGARLAIFDFDWDAHVVDSPFRETTRAIVRAFSDGIRNGWIGRSLPRLLRQNGVDELFVTTQGIFLQLSFYELLMGGFLVRAQESGIVAPDEVERWWEHLRSADASGTFLAGLTAFIVAGTKR
jgi:ubiquinone/menaquinone biosynthesis C-methylase UbiE